MHSRGVARFGDNSFEIGQVEALQRRIGITRKHHILPLALLLILHSVLRGNMYLTFFTSWVPQSILCLPSNSSEVI